MDPDATWLTLNNEQRPFAERVRAAEDLVAWVKRGGFVPAISELTDRGQFYGFCCGFIAAAKAVRSMPEVVAIRADVHQFLDGNAHHIVDSSARLLGALRD